MPPSDPPAIPPATPEDLDLDLEAVWERINSAESGATRVWRQWSGPALIRLAVHWKREAERLEAELATLSRAIQRATGREFLTPAAFRSRITDYASRPCPWHGPEGETCTAPGPGLCARHRALVELMNDGLPDVGG